VNVRDLFRPILAESLPAEAPDRPLVGTRLDRLTHQISATVETVRASPLQDELREVLVDVLQTISNQLRSSSSLLRMPNQMTSELAGSSPMILNFVNTMLDQDTSSPRRGTSPCGSDMAHLKRAASQASCGAAVAFLLDGDSCPSTFDESVTGIVAPLTGCRGGGSAGDWETEESLGWLPSHQRAAMLNVQLGGWNFEIFRFAELCTGRPMAHVAGAAIGAQAEALKVNKAHIKTFLASIEERYCSDNPYHNSLHGADVANSMCYFLRFPVGPLQHFSAFEILTGIVVASAHDVGHTGTANRYHTASHSPLAMLFNDQSVLENLHCAVMFAVIRVEASNFLGGLDRSLQARFRSLAVQMILDTDLAKHIQVVSRFRQDFLNSEGNPAPEEPLGPDQTKGLLCFLLKCSDVGGSAKGFALHSEWSLRIISEFYLQGDMERNLNLRCSPFCDRRCTNICESQHGFFSFIAMPMFTALDEYLQSQRLRFEVVHEVETNKNFWQRFDSSLFDHSDPLKNKELVLSAYRHLHPGSPGMDILGQGNVSRQPLQAAAFASDPVQTQQRSEPQDVPDHARQAGQSSGSSTLAMGKESSGQQRTFESTKQALIGNFGTNSGSSLRDVHFPLRQVSDPAGLRILVRPTVAETQAAAQP